MSSEQYRDVQHETHNETGARPSTFVFDGNELPICHVEPVEVKEGVVCDVYVFVDDTTKDLGIVRVAPGQVTPLQRVLQGARTVEGFISGTATLTVTSADETVTTYSFDETSDGGEVEVSVGQLMQWKNEGTTDLIFYEVCVPPCIDGRYENLADI